MNVTSEWYVAQQEAVGKPVSGSGAAGGCSDFNASEW